MTRQKGSLPRAYLRVDPHIASTHEAVGEFMRLLEAAHDQPRRGRFKNQGVLAAAIGRAAAKRSLGRGDVVGHDGNAGCLDPKGVHRELCPTDHHLYVNGWDEWQEGDWTVSERMTRVRERKRNSRVTSDTGK